MRGGRERIPQGSGLATRAEQRGASPSRAGHALVAAAAPGAGTNPASLAMTGLQSLRCSQQLYVTPNDVSSQLRRRYPLSAVWEQHSSVPRLLTPAVCPGTRPPGTPSARAPHCRYRTSQLIVTTLLIQHWP